MRVLMLCENAPSTDPARGDGSTMISAHLLREMPSGVEVDLVYFGDERSAPDAAALRRANTVRALPKRSRLQGLAAQPFTGLPRASSQRPLPVRQLRTWAADADVLYVHGLHVFYHALRQPLPFVAHEVDPWSEYWRQRAAGVRGPRGWYDLDQSRRAARLERAVAAADGTLVVVNERDAEQLRRSTGGRVETVSNGVQQFDDRPADASDDAAAGTSGDRVPSEPLLAFVGTLDYPPNVEAITRLATEVWPRVRAVVPDARVVVAGRHATPEVRARAGGGIEVLGEVEDVAAVFRRARASIYAGLTGRGTKNSVTESLVAGCPVVASTESARGQVPGPHLLVGDSPAALADLAVRMLRDDEANRQARLACALARGRVKGWAEAAAQMEALLAEAARRGRSPN